MTTAPKAAWADWLEYAERDLAAAHSLQRYGEPSPRHAGWLAEQAAEKALTAALLAAGVEPPDTHDLDVLRDSLPSSWQVAVQSRDLERLSAWYPLAVYPGEWAIVTDPGAAEMIELGMLVVASVRDELSARGFGPR